MVHEVVQQKQQARQAFRAGRGESWTLRDPDDGVGAAQQQGLAPVT